MADRRLLFALALALLAGITGAAQSDDATLPRFEAASVKPNRAATGSTVAIQGTSVRLIGVMARQLLVRAYGVEAFDIAGAPDWIGSDRFDVVATTTTPAAMPEVNRMVRALLVDRFHLAVHVEKRDRESYDLVVARRDGKPGPALKPSTDAACGSGPTLGPQRSAGGRCRLLVTAGGIQATGQPLDALAATLASIIGRPVIDASDLPGLYDFELTFRPERGGTASPGDDAPSIFTALQEQLGLKLDVRRSAGDVLVIDHIERPEAD
jgi:uncharacterized protein (TIGR03435 family)